MGILQLKYKPYEENQRWANMYKKGSKNFPTGKKIETLIRMAGIKIKNNRQSYVSRRENQYRGKGTCEVCGINEAYCQHHIILLKNGGYDTKMNRINICDKCHCAVHEWLIPQEAQRDMERFEQEYESIVNNGNIPNKEQKYV